MTRNKRQLKKEINTVCCNLFAECVATVLYDRNVDKNNMKALTASVLAINNEYIRRASHPEPGLSARVFYTDLREHFYKQVGEIVDQIANLE